MLAVLLLSCLVRSGAEESPSPQKPKSSWSKAEEWAWGMIIENKIADFNGQFPSIALENGAFKTEDRKLSPQFLRDLITLPEFSAKLPPEGLRIKGAWISEDLNLVDLKTPVSLWIEASLFEGSVDLNGATVNGTLSLEGSRIQGRVNLNNCQIESQLFLSGCILARNLSVQDAIVGDGTFLEGLTVGADANFNGTEFKGVLKIIRSHFKKLRLRCIAGKGVQISMSEVEEGLDMLTARISGTLFIFGSTIKGGYNANGLASDDILISDYQEGATTHPTRIEGDCNLTKTTVQGTLHIIGQFQCTGDLSLAAANVRDFALQGKDVDQTTVAGSLDIQFIKVSGDLGLYDFSIGAKLAAAGASVGRMTLDKVKVQSVEMRRSHMVDYCAVTNCLITAGNLDFYDSQFDQSFNLDGTEVSKGNIDLSLVNVGGLVSASNLSCRRGSFLLNYSNIGNVLNLSGAKLSLCDLSNAKISGSLVLWAKQHGSATWAANGADPAELRLRQCSVESIIDHPNAWPDHLDLLFFRYELWNTAYDVENGSGGRVGGWFRRWLSSDKQSGIHPQPSFQLARLLKNVDRSDEARDIIQDYYWAKLRQSKSLATKIWLGLFGLFTGFGQSLTVLFFWVAALILAGTIVMTRSGAAKANNMSCGFTYSLDRTIPFIELDGTFDDVVLSKRCRRWFYVQQFMGYFLATMLGAALFEAATISY